MVEQPPKKPEARKVQKISLKDRIFLEQEKYVPLAIAGGFLLFGLFSFVVYSWVLPGGGSTQIRTESRLQALHLLATDRKLTLGPYVVTDGRPNVVTLRDEEGWKRAPSFEPVTVSLDLVKKQIVFDRTTSAGQGPVETFPLDAVEGFSVKPGHDGRKSYIDVMAALRGQPSPRQVLHVVIQDPGDPGRADAVASWLDGILHPASPKK